MVDTVDDDKFMQEGNNCQGMKGEKWPSSEAPQNYGFTSVIADAEKDGKTGTIKDGAEGFMSFMGGNRNFPVLGVMDDRRHRLLGLAKDAAKGATAMFGLREWGQQLLNTADGFFMTGNTKKKIRLALVDNKNEQQQQPSQQQQADAGSGGASGSGGSTQQKQKGQKTLHKEESKIYIEQDGKVTTSAHGDAYSAQRSGSDSSTYYKDRSISAQSTANHTHIRCKANHIWVDANGCFSDMPIIIQQDNNCKD
jgi:phage gp45-like